MEKNQIKMAVIKRGQANLFLFLFVFFSIGSLQTMAQRPPYELSIHAGGAFSFLCSFPAPPNTNSFGYSGDVGGGFTYFFSPHCGIHLGAGLGLYNMQTKIDKIKNVTLGLFDTNDCLYDLHTSYFNYRESQQTIFLNIPVMLQFQSTQNEILSRKKHRKSNFYLMTGVKICLLMKNNYQSEVATLYNAAYYPELDNWLDTQTFAGLGTFDGNSVEEKAGFNILALFALETGVKWRISNTNLLYLGVYYDCGLNDPVKKIRQPLDHYADVENLANFTLLSFAKNIHYMAVGIKLRLAFTRDMSKMPCTYR